MSNHTFALFTQNVLANPLSMLEGSPFTLYDADVAHRATTVLRLKADDECIIFDGATVVHITLSNEKTKKGILRGIVKKAFSAERFTPNIHVYQAILRRDAFDSVVYTASQMGVTTITPIISQKIQRSWADDREVTRIEKVMISGCEQAKQFIAPEIVEPQGFAALITTIGQAKGTWLCLDPEGIPFVDMINMAQKNMDQTFHVIIGPEGGFTAQETEALAVAGVTMVALTKSILRSIDAAVLVLGALRSL